jgi:hypothetical protein
MEDNGYMETRIFFGLIPVWKTPVIYKGVER